MLLDRFIDTIFHPLRSLDRFSDDGLSKDSAPWPLWSLLAFVAVAGTMLYGASLHLLVDLDGFLRPALILTVAAGTGWILLGPCLSRISGRNLWIIAHVCMVTMLYGEAMLEAGFFLNLALWFWFHETVSESQAIDLNLAIVALSNAVMAVALGAQMKRLGMPVAVTLLLWIVVLNGAGIAVFLTLLRT